jgi:pimeloyl-ACP methyl ester carboxylesterase
VVELDGHASFLRRVAIGGKPLIFCARYVGGDFAAASYRDNLNTTEVSMTTIQPKAQGFLAVNGINLWHEVYGEGEPIVVAPGGLMTVPEMMPLIGLLARTRKVIGIELQGHGRTADTDRPLSQQTLGDDIAAVIDALKLGQADVVGYSLGGEASLRATIQHPDKVKRLILISTGFARAGWYPKAQEGMGSVNSALVEPLRQAPAGQYAREWPEPQRFGTFLDKLGAMMRVKFDWSADVRSLSQETLLIYADHDSLSGQHIADFFALLGGGITEPGWENTQFSKTRLAIIPGYSHYNLMSSAELPPLVERYLSGDMNHTGGAAAASEA